MERLQEAHLKAISLSKERIQQWEKFQSDYEILQERLQTLPQKLTHNIMVPFGRVAYMPGQLYHTNEILVLLGDNWFAKRTARQAYDIVERRKQNIIKELLKEKEYLKEISARYSFTHDIKESSKDTVEIKEEYDPVKEKEWRKARKEHKAKLATMRTTTDNSSSDKPHIDIWARLDELEREEEEFLKKEKDLEEERREDTIEFERQVESKTDERRSKQISLKDQPLEEPLDSVTSTDQILTISFTHSKTGIESETTTTKDDTRTTIATKESHPQTHSTYPRYQTPADIFTQYMSTKHDQHTRESTVKDLDMTETKSRSVSWDPQLPKDQAIPIQAHQQNKQPNRSNSGTGSPSLPRPRPLPFSGHVIERTAPADTSFSLSHQMTVDNEPQNQQPEQIVSRFKATRTK